MGYSIMYSSFLILIAINLFSFAAAPEPALDVEVDNEDGYTNSVEFATEIKRKEIIKEITEEDVELDNLDDDNVEEPEAVRDARRVPSHNPDVETEVTDDGVTHTMKNLQMDGLGVNSNITEVCHERLRYLAHKYFAEKYTTRAAFMVKSFGHLDRNEDGLISITEAVKFYERRQLEPFCQDYVVPAIVDYFDLDGQLKTGADPLIKLHRIPPSMMDGVLTQMWSIPKDSLGFMGQVSMRSLAWLYANSWDEQLPEQLLPSNLGKSGKPLGVDRTRYWWYLITAQYSRDFLFFDVDREWTQVISVLAGTLAVWVIFF